MDAHFSPAQARKANPFPRPHRRRAAERQPGRLRYTLLPSPATFPVTSRNAGTIPPQVKLEVFGANETGTPGTSVGMRPPGGVWNVATTAIPGGVRIKDTAAYDANARRFLWLEVTLVPE